MSFRYPALIQDLVSRSAYSHSTMAEMTYNRAAGADAYNGGSKPGYLDRAPLLTPQNRARVNEVYNNARAAATAGRDAFKAKLDRFMDYLTPRQPAYATR